MTALLILHLLAAGQVAPDAPAAPPPAQEEWYGWQTLTSDGAALLLVSASLILGSSQSSVDDGLARGGILLYGLGAPTIHIFHGRGWLMPLDLGLRVLLAGAGALAAASLGLLSGLLTFDPGAGFDRAINGLRWGAITGAVASMSIDAILFARKPAPPAPASQPAASTLRVAPFAGTARGAPVAGLAGAF